MVVYDIQNLTKWYARQPEPANCEITLQIREGEIFGFLGDNGAGKSTLVRQMANLLKPSSGSISLFGKQLCYDPLAVPRAIGYMPQSWMALNQLTVSEALYFTAHLRGYSRREARVEREKLLQRWQLEHLRHSTGRDLSGGERRLLQIGIAMAGSPPVLILDEPTNELSPQRRKQVWDALRVLNRAEGTTIIFITHDAIEAEKIIQRVGILHQGALVALGRPPELKRQIDETLRLEIYFAAGPAPRLPEQLQVQVVDDGHWVVRLQRRQVEHVLEVLSRLQIDDFRLSSATLEDLYLHYATPTPKPAND